MSNAAAKKADMKLVPISIGWTSLFSIHTPGSQPPILAGVDGNRVLATEVKTAAGLFPGALPRGPGSRCTLSCIVHTSCSVEAMFPLGSITVRLGCFAGEAMKQQAEVKAAEE